MSSRLAVGHRRLPTFPIPVLSQTTYQTELGQLLDLITAPEDKVDLSRFSIEKYAMCQ